jgi:hypothetical protein
MSESRDKHIEISVKDDDLTVAPTYVHVDHDNFVTWEVRGEKASLLVILDDGEAFGDATGRYRAGLEGDEREKVKQLVRGHPAVELRGEGGPVAALAKKPGIYHYRIALCVGGKIHADMYCPTVVVR